MTKYIRVDLPRPFRGYDYVALSQEREGWTVKEGGPYTVVWLDIQKVIGFTKRGGQVWPAPPSSESWGDKWDFFLRAWNPHNKAKTGTLAHMPRISFIKERIYAPQPPKIERGLLFTKKVPQPPRVHTFSYIQFENGRHRTEFFRSQGVMVMPFETRAWMVPYLQRYCAYNPYTHRHQQAAQQGH